MPPLLDRELEIKLDQLSPNLYRVELRFDDPDNDALGKPVSGKATFDFGALQKAFRNSDYGKLLTSALFAEPEIFAYFVTSKKGKEGSALRLRLFIDANAIELNSLRWELLEDPETGHMLTTSERIKFSRFVLTRDWRPIKLRAKSQLRALIAVSAPNNLSGGMAEVRKEIEIPAALKALSGIETIVLGQNEPVTLKALIAAIRTGVDIVYLVCHGSFPEEDKVARLWLQNEDGGTHKVMGKDLAQSFSDLIQPPRLMVLASCESGGSDGMFAHSALAPMLAENGVPAIIAMQAKISMRTVELAMPVFFSELLKDGQIDRAMAVARGSVRTELDAWVPALYLRLKSGSLWYQPGFGGTAKADDVSWDSVCIAAAKLELVPIIGPDLAEHILGTSTEFAAALAFDPRHRLPVLGRVAALESEGANLRLAVFLGASAFGPEESPQVPFDLGPVRFLGTKLIELRFGIIEATSEREQINEQSPCGRLVRSRDNDRFLQGDRIGESAFGKSIVNGHSGSIGSGRSRKRQSPSLFLQSPSRTPGADATRLASRRFAMPPQFGFAIVGCGMIARYHVRAITEIPTARVAALVSRTPASAQKLIEETGIAACPIFATIEEALKAPSVDAVIITTPSSRSRWKSPGRVASRSSTLATAPRCNSARFSRADSRIPTSH